jgi:hypothetical protein
MARSCALIGPIYSLLASVRSKVRAHWHVGRSASTMYFSPGCKMSQQENAAVAFSWHM